jgi:hypothetical protein
MPSEAKLISIDAINGNFFGGLPFSANWNFNDGSTPSTLTISVVNSSGKYNIRNEDLSYQTVQSVSLGNFNFNGYLIGYDIEESAQQNILTLQYIDTSILLEKWNVGLNGRHGQGRDKPENMILVGRTYGPCDENLDSTSTYANKAHGLVDPCDPCPNLPANAYKNSCQEDMLSLKILPVYYTFNELLDKIAQCGLNVEEKPSGDAIKTHRAQHVGTLKSALSLWCGELGLAYYFDPVNNNLHIISRQVPISVPDSNTLKEQSNIISVKHGATISNTFSRGFIGYLGTQGDIKEYTCTREDPITLNCLTLLDLITSATQAGASEAFDAKKGSTYDTGYKYVAPPLDGKVSSRQLDDMSMLTYATILAYYPLQTRLSFIWFQGLGIYGPKEAKNWIVPYQAPGEAGYTNGQGNGLGSSIYEWGNMNIIKVAAKNNNDSEGASLFNALNSQALADKKFQEFVEYVKADDAKNGINTNHPDYTPSYYFIIAQWDKNLANKQEERDVDRAKRFLGRYYYRSYDTMAVAGGSNDAAQVTIDAAGASCSYHPRGEYVTQLPIFSFGHTGKSKIGQIQQSLSKDESDNISSIGTPTGLGAEKYRSLKSFLLLDRSDAAKYSPDQSEFNDWSSLWNWYTNISPFMIDDNGRPDFLIKSYAPALLDTTLRLFVARKISKEKYKVTAKDGVDNPYEPKKPKTRFQTVDSIDGSGDSYRQHPPDGSSNASCGLMSPQTVEITMPGNLKIYPPAQSVVMASPNGEQFGTTPSSQAGFRVFIKTSSPYQKIIPKFEKVSFVNAVNTKKVGKVDYVYRDLNTESLVALTGQTQCLPQDDQIKKYVSQFASKMKSNNSQPANRASVKALGVMPLPLSQFGVKKGLSSVQITVGENGVYTDYSFEDKIVLPPSDDVIQGEILRQSRPNPVLGTSLQKMTSQQYSDVSAGVRKAKTFNTSVLNII